MRRRFFVERFDQGRARVEDDAAHHLGRVLRAQPGQLYELSDGSSLWLGRIETVTREHIDFALVEKLPSYIPALETTLLLAVVKFEAFEWALEKATELGVNRIVPLAASRSEKVLLSAAPKRAERWKKILLEASQQSRRLQVPQLEALARPETAFQRNKRGICLLLSESPDAMPLRELLNAKQAASAVLAIGPEGGWAEAEFVAARSAAFEETSLGRLILRTETAVVAALAALNFALSSE
jgi:16S rRNA (uracil1498-N3)-methyltransferase